VSSVVLVIGFSGIFELSGFPITGFWVFGSYFWIFVKFLGWFFLDVGFWGLKSG
jgi:hypothetical protein